MAVAICAAGLGHPGRPGSARLTGHRPNAVVTITSGPRLKSSDFHPIFAMPDGEGAFAVNALIEIGDGSMRRPFLFGSILLLVAGCAVGGQSFVAPAGSNTIFEADASTCDSAALAHYP